jgi:hypothetical protein
MASRLARPRALALPLSRVGWRSLRRQRAESLKLTLLTRTDTSPSASVRMVSIFTSMVVA